MKGGGGLHRATVTEDDLRPVTRRLKNGLRRHAACIIHRRSSGRRETVQGQKVEINRERRDRGLCDRISRVRERERRETEREKIVFRSTKRCVENNPTLKLATSIKPYSHAQMTNALQDASRFSDRLPRRDSSYVFGAV